MRILFCSGEVYPFSKTGGLADVAASLPKALLKLGHEVKIISPYYQNVHHRFGEMMTKVGEATVTMGDINERATFYKTDYDSIEHIFVDSKNYFDRRRFYGHVDDAERFTFFNFAILEAMDKLDFFPDIIHINDWQTSLVPYFLDEKSRLDSRYNIKTLLSIHNLEKQGAYPIEIEKLFNAKNYTYIHLNQVNFLKCGIMRASAINTVSETYRNEILTRFYGFTLDGALKARQYQLFGILNGLDSDVYNPRTDKLIYQSYDETNFEIGKKINKEALVSEYNLMPDKPLLAFVGRFARQKGINLMMDSIDQFLIEERINLIVVGEGEQEYETYFEELQEKFPNSVCYQHGFDQQLSLRAYAASDLFLMPSLFEPCGLNQMIAMRYGSLPLVRSTGGLKDTVTPYNKFTGIGVGFAFENFDSQEFIDTLNEALDLYHNNPTAFKELIRQAMHIKHGITKMSLQYDELYKKIIEDAI